LYLLLYAKLYIVAWGVQREVMIANGWIGAEDYYRALAEACGTPFKTELTPRDVTPAAGAGPRRSHH
jgi:hypothetical protein